ncbi:MAG TPA: DUF6178 family protein [Vicinamibacteria bacterium]|nr:DUF6178 family protein [Vicinamibacteria bacterium]
MDPHAVQQASPRRVVARLLDAPHLPELVQRLDPQRLHRLVRHCGLEECGEILALATTEQLTRVFDEDLWASAQAGAEEEFDADRFALWLEVLAELGPEVAARKIAGMDPDFVTAAVSRLVFVLDQELAIVQAAAAELGSEWEGFDADTLLEGALGRNPSHEMGGYTIVARRAASWDAVLSVLSSLEHDHHPVFAQLVRRCARLSTEYIVDNGGLYEVLSSDEQLVADMAAAREDRREASGYLTPAQAAAFLKLARTPVPAGELAEDPVTAVYFRELQARAKSNLEPAVERERAAPADALEREIEQFLASVEEPGAPRGTPPLLPARGDERLSRVRAHLLALQEQDPAVYGRCTEELAFLANVLISGCSFRSRRFRPVEATDAALAVCNLGLENGADGHSLVSGFRAGWRRLYEDVSLLTARRLADVLSGVRGADAVERQARDTARRLLRDAGAGEPWRARDAIEVVAVLDQPSWVVLTSLLDQCPTVPRDFDRVPGGEPRLRVSTELDFVSENRQLACVREFLDALPRALAQR